jgi:acetyltransferase-like isoleucine patch superfamily enzyme
MEYKLTDNGSGNTINVCENDKLKGLNIEIKGNNNQICIDEGFSCSDFFIRIWGNDNKVVIESHCKLNGRALFDGNEQLLHIGMGTTFERVGIVIAEGCNVEIGKDCMFSYGIQVRTSDAHSIIDINSKKRTNQSKGIKIGEHVWVGMDAIIQKGCCIPDDSIVGLRAVVNKSFFTKNIAISGIPAQIVKEGVTWDRKLI